MAEDTKRNRQGGIPLPDNMHRPTPQIVRGDRAAEGQVSDDPKAEPIGRVVFSRPVDGAVAPQMVNDHGEASPDSAGGDLAQVRTEGSVWEAVEDGPAIRSAEPEDDSQVLSRARETSYAPRPLGQDNIKDG